MIPFRCLYALAVVALGAATLLLGCKKPAAVVTAPVSIAPTRNETSPFEMAVRFLNSLDEYQPQQVSLQILSHLREWARQEPSNVDWFADPMFRRIPSGLKELFTADRLATNEFQLRDIYVLQETIWLRDVAKNVAAQPLYETEVQGWIQGRVEAGQLTRDQADDLSIAYRLFDWTVRNLQLDPELDAKDVLEGAPNDRTALRHVYNPRENLLYGHGDWLERSRVFMLLCRQMGVHAVMLVAQRAGGTETQPWVPAVLCGSELYLFDPLLGLPLPGEQGQGFGRLADYAEHPEWLDQLKRPGAPYRISAGDLSQLVAAVDATPEALSQRMKQIESRLTGDRKMVLTVAPTPLGLELRKNKHITNVEIWTRPYRGYQFAIEMSRNPQAAAALLTAKAKESQPFETRSKLMQGRLLHFRGIYRGDADQPGATKRYLESRASKEELASFNVPLERLPPDSPILTVLPEDPGRRKQAYREMMGSGRELALWSKDMATHWLGVVAFEKHEFRVAADYFRRVVDAQPESFFRQSASYNLARALEALAAAQDDAVKREEAVELFLSLPDSPQHAGNGLRATRLK